MVPLGVDTELPSPHTRLDHVGDWRTVVDPDTLLTEEVEWVSSRVVQQIRVELHRKRRSPIGQRIEILGIKVLMTMSTMFLPNKNTAESLSLTGHGV